MVAWRVYTHEISWDVTFMLRADCATSQLVWSSRHKCYTPFSNNIQHKAKLLRQAFTPIAAKHCNTLQDGICERIL